MPSGSSKSKSAKAKRNLNLKGFSSEKLKATTLIEIKECIFDTVNHIIQDKSILEEDDNFEHPIVDDTEFGFKITHTVQSSVHDSNVSMRSKTSISVLSTVISSKIECSKFSSSSNILES